MRIMLLQRFAGCAFLLLGAAASASAQTFAFSNCSAGITFSATINSFISRTGPTNTGDGSRNFNYIIMGSYSLTVGRSTQTSSGLGAIAILYTSLGGVAPPITTFTIRAPNAAGTGGPGLGQRADALSWGVTLQGAGDLLPTGLGQTLPPLSVWALANGSMNQNFIFGDGKTLAQPLDTLGACATNPLLDLLKMLGDLLGLPGSCHCGGHSINVATGNLFERVDDYQTAGQNKVAFSRFYNSLAAASPFAVSLGPSWGTTYDRYLRLVTASSVIAERQDGRQVSFTQSSGVWAADTDVDIKLTNSGTTWTLTDSNDAVETYRTASASQALLQTIRERNGYTQTLQYNADNQVASVTDSFNRQLGFTYNAGRLQTVTTPDGLTLSYGYSGGRLSTVGYSTSPATSQTYLYENTAFPSALTGIVDENGNRYATWTYDTRGRALSSQYGAGADVTRVAYNDTDGSRTLTYPLGAQLVYRFTTLQKSLKLTQIDRLATTTTAAATSKFTYDSNGYMASETDWNGNLTNYVNDARGRPVSVVEAAGTAQARTITILYHPSLRLPARIVEPGVTTVFTYDSTGNLLTRTRSDTSTATGASRTWTYTWSNSLLASVKKPRTDVAAVTQFTYDSSGALTATTNALGQTTRITQHLPGGLPETLVDPNGVTTQMTYDARQRLLTRTVNLAARPLTTSYKYDSAGNLIGVSQPDGSALTYTYDAAHRLTGVTDLLNQSIAFTLDALGGQTQTSVLDPDGNRQRTRSNSFDALGRLRQFTGGAGQTTSYTYDANGHALTVTDPLSRVTQRTLDALNRPIRITDAAKGVTATSFDPHGRPISVTDPNGATTSYVYDGFGDLIQRVSPDSGTTTYRYDLNGNLTQRVDANGAIANYTYDALDRAIAVSYPGDAAQNVSYSYDEGANGIGRLTTVADAAGTLHRSYDERGNVLSETRAIGAAMLLTTYSYDDANRVRSITYPSGWTIAYTRDAIGRATAINAQPPDGSAPVPVLANVAYQPFGPANSLTFGNGVAETRRFDADYRLIQLADAGAGALQNLTYAYDAANNVSSITDGVTAANSQSFDYDALNRLTGASGGYGGLNYTYDSVGNRLSQSIGGSATTYSYAPRSNQLASVRAGGTNQMIGYTKTGHIGAFTPDGGAPTSLTYNEAGRLAAVTSGSNQGAQYTYDGFGQRLIKVGSVTATTLYQYDRRGRLLEETDGQGVPQADYIYLGDLPIATLSPSSGKVYFLHGDRLGTPQVATDSDQNIVWTASYGPFGEMSAVPGSIVQNLRLPGQEFDVDTGLYHNGFRDYVPGWGRYLESDPVGLAGGLNTYGYAQANPARYTDRRGLSVIEKALEWAAEKLVEHTATTIISVPLNETFPELGEYGASFVVGGTIGVGLALWGSSGAIVLCPLCVEAAFTGGGAGGVATDVALHAAWESTVSLADAFKESWNDPGLWANQCIFCAPEPAPDSSISLDALNRFVEQYRSPTGTCTVSHPPSVSSSGPP